MKKSIQFRMFLVMITPEILETIRATTNLSMTAFAITIGLKQDQYTKIIKYGQAIPAHAVGEIIRVYKIHPNWLFGYEGDLSKPMYMDDLIPKSEMEKVQKENYELRIEMGEAYKQLAAERRIDYKKEDAQLPEHEAQKVAKNL